MLPREVAAGVAAILGDGVRVADDVTPAWSATTRSVLVVSGGGAAEFVVQWSVGGRRADRRGIGRRLRLGRDLARVAPWLPVPEVIGGSVEGPASYVVSRFTAGTSGRELLGDDAGAALIGAAAGRIAQEVARVPVAGLRLSRTWSEPALLAGAAGRWLAASRPDLPAAVARRVGEVVERLPAAFEGIRPVFAHGDLAPVNLVMDGGAGSGAVVALLDLERARLAHPLFDAAWWSWIVRYHHPARWPAAGPAFLSAAGIEETAEAAGRIEALAVLQCLEMLATTPRRRSEARREWAARIGRALEWGDPSGAGESEGATPRQPGLTSIRRAPRKPPAR